MTDNTTNILLMLLGLALAAGLAYLALGEAPSPTFLFVQQADSGTFELADDTNPDEYILTLEGVWPETTYFSDRPQRIAGTMSNEAFLGLEGMFVSDDPPNAAVVVSDATSKEEDVIIVELMNPQYSMDTSTLTYTARLLDEKLPKGLTNWGAWNDASLPDSFSSVTLFIDSINCFGAPPSSSPGGLLPCEGMK